MLFWDVALVLVLMRTFLRWPRRTLPWRGYRDGARVINRVLIKSYLAAAQVLLLNRHIGRAQTIAYIIIMDHKFIYFV